MKYKKILILSLILITSFTGLIYANNLIKTDNLSNKNSVAKDQVSENIIVVDEEKFLQEEKTLKKESNDSKVIVVEEDYSKCKDYDITNYELEDYFNSIEDEEKRELLRKIFYYPSVLFTEDPVDNNLDTIDAAKKLAESPIEDLRKIVADMEKNMEKNRGKRVITNSFNSEVD